MSHKYRFILLLSGLITLFLPLQSSLAASANIRHLVDFSSVYYDKAAQTTCGTSSAASPTTSGSGGTQDLTYQDSSRSNRSVPVTVYLPSDGQPHPLVVFAPGRNQNSRSDGMYGRYLQAVASEGFVVAGVNFTDNTAQSSWAADAQDVNFAVNKVLADTSLQGKIDTAAGVGVFGHSDGGAVVMQVGYGGAQNSHIKAIISGSGASGGSSSGPPLLVFAGSNDFELTGAQSAYNSVNPTYKAMITFVGATHTSYLQGGQAGSDQYNPAADVLTGAFFKRFLSGNTDASTKLSQAIAPYASIAQLKEAGVDTPSGGGSTSTSPATTGTSTTAQCCPTGGGVNLSGSDDETRVWNYLTGRGLAPFQAAGIMGNIANEDPGFNANAQEPQTTSDIPRAGPFGYGIVQWTPGTELIPIAQAAGKPVNDLSFQLDTLWNQLFVPNSPPGDETGAGYGLKATTNVADATRSFEKLFERHAGGPQPTRVSKAEAILATYGSGQVAGGTSGSSPSSGGSACGSSGSTIDANLPQGSKEELISQIKATNHVTNVGLLTTAIRQTTLAMLLRLAQKYTFTMTQGAHLNGTAVDLQNINGKGVPQPGGDYALVNSDADQFLTDATTLEPSGKSWIGVPNQHYKDLANAILNPKGGMADLDTPETTGATGPHFHLACPPDAS